MCSVVRSTLANLRCFAVLMPNLGILCIGVLITIAPMACSNCFGQEPQQGVAGGVNPAELEYFESKIRPILVKHCLECHSGEDAKGSLSLEHAQGWRNAGVIEPGNSEQSRLFQVVTSQDREIRMPPEPARSLSNREIDLLRKWIDRGAYDPREGSDDSGSQESQGPKRRSRVFEITDADRAYWAFQPLRSSASKPKELSPKKTSGEEPSGEGLSGEPRSALNPLEELSGGSLASPRTQLRRLFLDLWGMPPTFEQVAAFEEDPSAENWNRYVDELLASRTYAERWGSYWLDWVRFAETNGYERDGIKPNAWRYRDYVIDSLEQDKPYDQFVIEQLAGDQWALEQGWTVESHPEQWRSAMIATGFYRLHVWDDEPDDTLVAQFDEADDVMVSIGSAFMGLTVGCARCHDHKFDPLSQRDYYSMLSFFRDVEPYGLNKKGGGGRGTGRIQRSLVPESQTIAWEENRRQQIAEKQKLMDQATDPAVRLDLQGQIKQLQDMVPGFDSALAIWDFGSPVPETFVLHRGDPNEPREKVAANVPTIFGETVSDLRNPTAELNQGGSQGGMRLAFAKWLVDPKHPLTARVIANRVWQRHFGAGIVPTIDDFGATGLPPENIELLDYLASELIRSGWSLKHLHRIILRSEAYRNAKSNVRRLDAESVRDSILLVSGRLGGKRSGPSVYPKLTQEVKDSANPVSLAAWQESPIEEQNCRSIYLVVKRSLRVPFLEVLDYPGGTSPTAIRTTSTTAPQALLMLNDPWIQEQAIALNDRARSIAGEERLDRLSALWKLVYQRVGSDQEYHDASLFLESGKDESARWVQLCRALLSSNEFLYTE
ncbi:MAG: hypothetical protein RJB11_2248 [Planctomycetota bacterium]